MSWVFVIAWALQRIFRHDVRVPNTAARGYRSYETVTSGNGFAIVGVPPFGHSTQLRVFVDPDLLQYDEVWAAAGTWNDNFGANPNDIVRVAGGVVTDLKRS